MMREEDEKEDYEDYEDNDEYNGMNDEERVIMKRK